MRPQSRLDLGPLGVELVAVEVAQSRGPPSAARQIARVTTGRRVEAQDFAELERRAAPALVIPSGTKIIIEVWPVGDREPRSPGAATRHR